MTSKLNVQQGPRGDGSWVSPCLSVHLGDLVITHPTTVYKWMAPCDVLITRAAVSCSAITGTVSAVVRIGDQEATLPLSPGTTPMDGDLQLPRFTLLTVELYPQNGTPATLKDLFITYA